mmetsp:Transcript_104423/g.336554  ORF Transcript_104423/g.336554 Transcript_104423/m.336554 type:complete len:223 (-) Transcript_104423:384-1052(-)
MASVGSVQTFIVTIMAVLLLARLHGASASCVATGAPIAGSGLWPDCYANQDKCNGNTYCCCKAGYIYYDFVNGCVEDTSCTAAGEDVGLAVGVIIAVVVALCVGCLVTYACWKCCCASKTQVQVINNVNLREAASDLQQQPPSAGPVVAAYVQQQPPPAGPVVAAYVQQQPPSAVPVVVGNVQQQPPPKQWNKLYDANSQKYYYQDAATGDVTWTAPPPPLP